jgi:glucokinase
MEKGRYAIGIDVGGTSIKAGVVCLDAQNAQILEHAEYPTNSVGSISEFVHLLSAQSRTWLTQYQSVKAVGIGFPACVEWPTGVLAVPPNIAWWDVDGYPLGRELATQIGCDVVVDNDAHMAAVAECTLGYGKQWNTFLFVTLGTGVGGALIIDRQLVRGERGCAGEIGHMIIDSCAPLESPAYRTGVLERYVGRNAIIERAQRICIEYPTSVLASMASTFDVEHIGRAATQGDSAARRVLQEIAEYLGIGLASAAALLGMSRFVVAGGIAGLPDLFFEYVQRTLRARALPALSQHVQVVRSSLGATAGVLGAALAALEHAAE